jgi:predicted metal-dependent hydrolase
MLGEIQYTLKRNPRAKSLRVSVYCDGTCVVTAPVFVGESYIKKFLFAKNNWIQEKLRGFMPFRPVVKKRNSRVLYLEHKEAARKLVLERLPVLNAAYGFTYKRISIKNHTSRWGSCSAKGNLNFNFKIVLLPTKLSDYIIVHELCHLHEFNHSKNFWDLVARTCPDYKELRNDLKKTHT